MSWKDGRAWKISAAVFAVAVALNFPWEMLQAPLYRMDTGRLPAWLHCFRASLGDALIVLLILAGGAWIMGSLDWFRRPRPQGYAWMLFSGLVIAVAMDSGARPEALVIQTGDASPARPGDRARPCRSDARPASSDFRHRNSARAQATSPKGGIMKSKLWLIAVGASLFIAAACARREQAPAAETGASAETPAAGAEKTYPLRGKVVSHGPGRNEIKVDHEKVEGLWEPMTMTFEVRGGEPETLPAAGSTIRATLHVQDSRYWLTDVKPE